MAGSGIESQIDQTSVSILGTEEVAESTESLSYLVLFCDCTPVQTLKSH